MTFLLSRLTRNMISKSSVIRRGSRETPLQTALDHFPLPEGKVLVHWGIHTSAKELPPLPPLPAEKRTVKGCSA